jgi:signal transduction histidine kinase
VTALHHLLDDVTALARLQAGQEQRRIEAFDAAHELSRLVDDIRPLADEKRLSISADGPAPLSVQGDRVKVRRIVQNLLLNSLKYTVSGGVTLRWGDTTASDDSRWFILVEDTGPGFHAGPGAPIVEALGDATAESNGQAFGASPAGGAHDARPVSQSQGEGLGLAIVKRLCDLLNATVELETKAGQGTSIRVLVPRRYASAPA